MANESLDLKGDQSEKLGLDNAYSICLGDVVFDRVVGTPDVRHLRRQRGAPFRLAVHPGSQSSHLFQGVAAWEVLFPPCW